MDGIIRYTAEDALKAQEAQTLEGPGLWVRAADFDEREKQAKQREVALQDRLTLAEQRLDDYMELLRKVSTLRGTLDQHGLLEEVDAALANQSSPVAEACQFPQSCTTRCDCDIPDFSPGNGNKARRRAESL
ncbi:MAG: hypothetical protein C0411_00965, partial [Pseudomonas sp.]|nr:hypothetical protein [Pseudomonas sp.]